MIGTVIFIDSVHEVLQSELEKAGFNCFIEEEKNPQELSLKYPETCGIVLRSRWKMTPVIMDLFPNLQWIARSGSGLENIDIDYAKEKGIRVLSSPEGNADAVGEYVVGMMLTLLRHYVSANLSVKNSEWLREKHRGKELKSQTIGIIGLGHMGKSVAKKLDGLGCSVMAHDKYLIESPLPNIPLVSLDEIFLKADIVTLHLPLTPETRDYANFSFFQSFKKPIYFINTARGQHCVTQDLIHAVRNGQVLGAALDVLEFESTQLIVQNETSTVFKELLETKNILLSPHIAGWTTESYYKLSKVLAEKILGY
jgi:D-3-phosphoglycerate dehydrogenase